MFLHQNPVYTSALSPYVLHAPPISFISIWSPEHYWVGSTAEATIAIFIWLTPYNKVLLQKDTSACQPIFLKPQKKGIPWDPPLPHSHLLYPRPVLFLKTQNERTTPVLINRRAAARYRALASIMPGRESFSRNLPFSFSKQFSLINVL